jgi:hypothetical protein
MKLRVCICCGEPMAPGASKLSRNPNVCASCSSLADGSEEPERVDAARSEHGEVVTYEKPTEARRAA